MKRLIACLVTSAVALGAVGAPVVALPKKATVQTYRNLPRYPIDMAWVPGTKRIFFTEKDTGRIRVMQGRDLKRKACAKLPVWSGGEGGLLGITLHPNFKNNGYLYVYWSSDSPRENRVTRFKVDGKDCRRRTHIVTGIRTNSSNHYGGQLEFVGKKLFVSVGDAGDPAAAQNTAERIGKILRYNPNGSIPKKNPFGNAVWSYGHRNPFGLTRKPGTNKLYSTENGPECNDELNHIKRGRNYGWGATFDCPNTDQDGDNPKAPMKRWENIVVPTDPLYYRGRYGTLSDALYVGTYATRALWRFDLNAKGTRIKRERVIHTAPDAILDVSKGPGGWLYYLTPTSMRRIKKS